MEVTGQAIRWIKCSAYYHINGIFIHLNVIQETALPSLCLCCACFTAKDMLLPYEQKHAELFKWNPVIYFVCVMRALNAQVWNVIKHPNFMIR